MKMNKEKKTVNSVRLRL